MSGTTGGQTFSFQDAADPAGAGKPVAAAAGTFSPSDAGVGMSTEPAGPTTGYLPNIWAAVHEGAAALSRISEFSPWRAALEGSDELFGTHLAPPSISGDLMRSPAVTQVEPEPGTLQGPVRAGVRGAVAMLGPAGVGKAIPEAAALAMGSPVRAATYGALASMGGAAVADQVPEQYRDVADTATQFATMGLAGAGEFGVRQGMRAVKGAVSTAAGPLSMAEPQPVVNPETGQQFQARSSGVDAVTGQPIPGEPIAATPRVQDLAARRVAQSLGASSPGEAAEAIPTGPWGETPQPAVPGTQQTLGQVTGNYGALAAERQSRNLPYGRQQFTAQEASNNLARVAALQGASPEEVSSAAGDHLRSQLAAAQAEAEANTGAAQTTAAAGLEAAGVQDRMPGEQQMGAEQRAALEARREPIKASADAAMDALDPDKKLAIDATPIGDVARKVRDEGGGEGGSLEPAETGPLNAAAKYNDVIPFQKLRSLMGNVSGAMRRIASTPGLGKESPPYRRMTMLMASIHDTMAETASRLAERDATNAPGERLIDRLSEADQSGRGNAAGTTGEVAGGVAAGGTAGAAGERGAGAAGVGPAAGQGTSPLAGGVEASPTVGPTAPPRPQNLVDFLHENGGLRPNQELPPDADKITVVRRVGKRAVPLSIVRNGGMSLQEASERARDAGFTSQSHGNMFDERSIVPALEEHQAGRPVYRQSDAAAVEWWRQEDARAGHEEALLQGARSAVSEAEHQEGVRLSDNALEHAARLLLFDRDMHPAEALRQASFADEEGMLQQNAAGWKAGVSPLARQAEVQLPGGRTLVENFPPEARAALKAANKQWSDYKNTYRKGEIGDVLRSGPTAGTFRLDDAAVPGKLFQPGVAGAGAADRLIAEAGSPQAAERTLGGYPALQLRNAAMKDGVLNIPAYQRFMNKYAPALAKFPGLAGRFATAANAQQAALDAAARGDANIRSIQNSAARFYLGKGDAGVSNQKAISDLLASKNPEAEARDLMTRVAPNEAATEGVRRNFLEHLLQRATGTAEAGTTGESALSGAAYQRLLQDKSVSAVARVVLRPDQWRMVQDVGAELRQQARAWNAVKVPGSPGTAADMHALEAHGHPSMFFQAVVGEKGGELLAHMLHLGGPWGPIAEAAGAVGAMMLRARKAVGYDTVDRLVTEMQLNPALGRTVLQQAAVRNPNAPAIRSFAERLVSRAIGVGAQQQQGAGE